jgi:hypothetical protein
VVLGDASNQEEDYSKSYNIFHKIDKGNYSKKLNMNQSNGFYSAARLKKRLESPINQEEVKIPA